GLLPRGVPGLRRPPRRHRRRRQPRRARSPTPPAGRPRRLPAVAGRVPRGRPGLPGRRARRRAGRRPGPARGAAALHPRARRPPRRPRRGRAPRPPADRPRPRAAGRRGQLGGHLPGGAGRGGRPAGPRRPARALRARPVRAHRLIATSTTEGETMRRHRPRTGLATVLGLLVAATTLVAAPGEPAGAAPPTLPAPNSHGLTVVSGPTAVPGKPNQYDITVRTAAVFTPRGTPTTPSDVSVPVKVRVLLPAGYDPDRAQPYDVLYLLHGGGGTYADWSTWGDVAGNLPGFDGIVVMPEGGRAGWYSDWPGRTAGNFAPLWETFHVHQLVPWVDANFNTSGTRSGRAVAGLSMGGYGALRYAGRHPHLFSAVGAFSAGTDINPPGARKIISDSMWQAGA